MATTKKNESARKYKLKTDRAHIQLDRINSEYVSTVEASEKWQTVRAAIIARLDCLPDELLAAVKDRSAPGIVQEALQRTVYAALDDLASPSFVDRALSKRGR